MGATHEQGDTIEMAEPTVTRSYVVIDEQSYPTDTVEEVAAARDALLDAGVESAPVYVGEPDCPDSYRTGEVLWAR